jgi:glutathione S-transferase
MTTYPLTIAALLLALAVYTWSGALVGRARGKYGVEAPATSGVREFDRVFRAQMNTLEQIVLFVPLLIVAAALWGDRIAAGYGLLWSIGRILYVVTYARDPAKRAFGFLLSAGASLVVLIGLAVTLALRAFA